MVSKINADTSDGLKITSDTSGTLDIQSGGTTKMTVGSTIDVQGNELILDADADTSIHADTDDQIDFKIGGTDRLTISSTGKVTSTQTGGASNFEIQTTADSTLGSDLTLYQNSSSPADNDIISFISFAGNDSGGTKTTFAQIRGIATDVTDGTEDGEVTFFTNQSGTLTESLKLHDNGRVDMGTGSYSNGAKLTLSYTSTTEGGLRCADTVTSGTHTQIQFLRGGTQVGKIECADQSSTAYVTSSDYRMKENVNYTWDGTTKLKQLKPAEFTWKAEYDSNKTKVQGFIAHEVSDIVPEAVSGEKDGEEMQGIDQSKLVPLLVKTIQELEARITALEGE